MELFNQLTTFKEFKEMLNEDLRIYKIGQKKSKYTTIMNMNESIHFTK